MKRYNVPAPRYTSYPTVPFWDEPLFSFSDYSERLKTQFNPNKGLSLYIHLPYCESLCTFCGCNKRITKNHAVEDPYIEALLKEWSLYVDVMGSPPLISEIHLGGGTPTFFSPQNLQKLITGILANANISEAYEFGLEGHPNNTSEEHLSVLADLGFNRVSFGVQDVNKSIQEAIHRVQPWENVERVFELSKKYGYKSVNFDLVYGLPFQTAQDVENTINKTIELLPGRIAFYSYAHVPWIKGVGQRKFTEKDLPKDAEKRQLYELGRKILEDNHYHEIGMDHFALESDSLFQSMKNGTLHRNFMGYTSQRTNIMVGLGVSAISDTVTAFAQNNKSVEEYLRIVNKGKIPVFRGHLLTDEDLEIREAILELMCFGKTQIPKNFQKEISERLVPLIDDEIVFLNGNNVEITATGKPFLRNACMAFDLRLWETNTSEKMFSMSV